MSLIDLWAKSPDQLQGKQVQQLVAIAGDGKLTDDGTCSKEFREFLASVPSANLTAYCEQCLSPGFTDSKLGVSLVKRSRAGYSSPDKKIALNCSVSKEHNPDTHPNYWFAFHPHQQVFLDAHEQSFVAFGCGSSKRVIVVPFKVFQPWLAASWTTPLR
jgi:hypothetical protein